MRDYEELVRELRGPVHSLDCEFCNRKCCYPDGVSNDKCVIIQAADAIEELSREKKRLDDKAIELQAIADHYEAASQGWFQTACEYKDAAPKWISVEERLPEKYHQVLVYGQNGLQIDYYAGAKSVCGNPLFMISEAKATHWMPLPEPPEEGKA